MYRISTVLGRKEAIATIVSLTVLIRLIHLFFIASTPILDFPELFVLSDMHMFDEWAKLILRGDVLSVQHEPLYARSLEASATFFKAPFYAYLIALMRVMFSETAIPLALLQIAAAGVSCFLLFRVTESLFGHVAALAAGTFFALYGPSINYDVLMLRRPWITLAMLAISFGLVRLRIHPTNARAVGLGLALGFGILVFEGFVILPLFVLGVVLWSFRLRAGSILAGGILLGMTLPLLCVFIRNYYVGAPLLHIAVTGSLAFALFNSAGSHPQFFVIDPSVHLPILEQADGHLMSTVLASLRTFDGIGPIVLFYLKRALALLSSYEIPDNLNYYYVALQSPLITILPAYRLLFATAMVGLTIALWKKLDISPLLPCGLVAIALLFVAAPLSRYRISLVIMLLPLSGYFVQYLWNWSRERRLVPLGMSLVVATTLYATGYWIEAKVFPGTQFGGSRYYRTTEFLLITDFYLDRNMQDKARDETQRWVNLQERFGPRDLTTLALRQARLGQVETARQNLETARLDGQIDAFLLGRIGDIYWQRLKDPQTAWAVYKEALQANPKPKVRQRILKRLHILEGK